MYLTWECTGHFVIQLLNPKFHWLRQIATTLCEFRWQFWIFFLDAIAKAKKLIRKSIAQNSKVSFTDKEFFSFGNGI